MYFETIRAKEIEAYAAGRKSIIIDLRDPEEYKKECVPGTVNIPYEEIEENIDELGDYEAIILYCDRGNLSLLAARDLGRLGIHNIYSVAGGYRAYCAYHNSRTSYY